VPTLVRVPEHVRKIKQFDGLRTVDPHLLRGLFKSREASIHLENAANEKFEVIETVLNIITSDSPHDNLSFEGCRILPLADRTLGTLRINAIDIYFYVSDVDASTFSFASDIFIIDRSNVKRFMTWVLSQDSFNVKRLSLKYIGGILGKGRWNEESPLRKEPWLMSFWTFFNQNYSSDSSPRKPASKEFGIGGFPIYLTTCNREVHNMKPANIDQHPVVVEPDVPKQKELCLKIPGLHLLNRTTLPSDMLELENSLDEEDSLERFIRSLEMLARQKGMSLEQFTLANLSSRHLKVWYSSSPSVEAC
jgi:sacsin